MNLGILFQCCLSLASAVLSHLPAEDLTDQVRANVETRTKGTSPQLFTTFTDGTRFVRNPRCWLNDMKGLSAVHAGYGPGATAITPWHVIGANHWKHESGAKLYFCDLQNHSIVRCVVASMEIRPDIKSDIWLAVLDQRLPVSITPMPLMPPAWTNYVRHSRFPVAALNKKNEFGAGEVLTFRQPVSGWYLYGYLYQPSSLAPTLQFAPLQGGDSGRPIVTLVNGNLVLLGHLTFEPGKGRFAGPDYSAYSADIQSGIRKLGTNNAATAQNLRTIDLSDFK